MKHTAEWYSDRLSRKYGANIINDLTSAASGNITLTEVGKRNGFTAENARKLFEKTQGYSFSLIRDHRVTNKAIAIQAKRDPRNKITSYRNGSVLKGAQTEAMVFRIALYLGYKVDPFQNKTMDLCINGYSIEVKASYSARITSPFCKTKINCFRLRETQMAADFAICHAVQTNSFFIIPQQEFPAGRIIYIPEVNERQWLSASGVRSVSNKYYEFLEAWHLLNFPKTDTPLSPPLVATGFDQKAQIPGDGGQTASGLDLAGA